MIEAVAFGIGETLIKDDRGWNSWIDWLGVPRHTLSALVGAVVAQGRDNADAIATSAEWGVAKPDPEFFARATALTNTAPEHMLHVDDHPHHDTAPAASAGLRTAHTDVSGPMGPRPPPRTGPSIPWPHCPLCRHRRTPGTSGRPAARVPFRLACGYDALP